MIPEKLLENPAYTNDLLDRERDHNLFDLSYADSPFWNANEICKRNAYSKKIYVQFDYCRRLWFLWTFVFKFFYLCIKFLLEYVIFMNLDTRFRSSVLNVLYSTLVFPIFAWIFLAYIMRLPEMCTIALFIFIVFPNLYIFLLYVHNVPLMTLY